MTEDATHDLIALTASVIEAYVSYNKLNSDDLARLIGSTHEALKTAGQPAPSEPQTPKADKAAIRKSIHPEHLTSFIDGRAYKSLKRHLSANGMTAATYRETYGLPNDYPLVAASYSAQRSALAKSLGLGRKAAVAPVESKGSTPRGGPKAIAPKDETFT